MNRVRIMGGLGNQLFQYAFSKEIEYKSGNDVQLSTAFYKEDFNLKGERIPTRYFLLDKFNIDYSLVPDNDNHKCKYIIHESEYDITQSYDDSYFIGYWQSEKFFPNVKNDVKGSLTLKNKYIDGYMSGLVEDFDKCESVAVHVRRTDYVSLGIYPLCGVDYYETALGYIKERIDNPVLYIFSDDLKWCNDNLTGLCGCETNFVDSGADYKDWYLMSRTRHNIIANSSFSFWAAYSNPNPDKIVCAPKKWGFDDSATPTDVEEWFYF